jgi:SpoVK/Ycf46/Vps4 family AAA+-type ATPase
MAFCTKCGTQLADDANFCGKCGTAMGAAAQGNAAGSTAQAGGTAKSVEDALKELNELTGLASVKEAVTKIASMAQAQKLTGVTQPLYRHFVFMGNPGTEKTAVARILADVFKAVGLLPTNNVAEADRSRLVGAYIGQTAKQVNEQIDKAMGGILFIDEAYSLLQGQGDMFGQEAIDTLLKRMEDDRGKFVVIMSGDTKKMEEFLQSNSGFRSRITDCLNFEE